MKRMCTILFALVLSALLLNAKIAFKTFLAAAINVNASTTAVNGTDFDSREFRPRGDQVAITVTFTRAAGSASTLDVYFQASYDNATWASFADATLQTATNTAVITGTTVRVTYLLNVYGVAMLRVSSVDNTDGSNNLTAINIVVSYRL